MGPTDTQPDGQQTENSSAQPKMSSSVNKKMAAARTSFNKKKKKLPMNILEFAVGAVLLIFCLSYLSNHPAEKSSIITGIEVLFQKTRVFVSQFTTGRGELLQKKFDMQRAFQELIFIGEDGDCLTEADMRKLYSYRDNLEAMSARVFDSQQYNYQSLLEGYFNKVKTTCDKYLLDQELFSAGRSTSGTATMP